MSSLKINDKYPWTHHIYTDGSFRGNGTAACAYLIYHQKSMNIIKMGVHAHRGMTINQMELMAINHALDHPNMKHVIIYTDSAYSLGCLTGWYKTWAKSNWISANGEPVKNKDLIIEIRKKIDALKFCQFVKISAHTGDEYNTVVDRLASHMTKRMVEDQSIVDDILLM